MKKKTIEIDLGENKVSCKQSSSGFWYCADITINCTSVIDGVELMDRAISSMKKILEKYNVRNKDKEE